MILQNFVPHPRYYGAEVAEIADEAALARWGRDGGPSDGGRAAGSSREFAMEPLPKPPSEGAPSLPIQDEQTDELPLPGWASPVSVDDIKRLIAQCRELMPDVGVQVPPNLSEFWPELVEAGATDLGGLSANGDHISPEEPFPSPHQVRKELAPRGYALSERLCVYPQYMDPEWMEQGVLDVVKLKYWSFIPRRGSGRRSEERIEAGVGGAGDRQGARGSWS